MNRKTLEAKADELELASLYGHPHGDRLLSEARLIRLIAHWVDAPQHIKRAAASMADSDFNNSGW